MFVSPPLWMASRCRATWSTCPLAFRIRVRPPFSVQSMHHASPLSGYGSTQRASRNRAQVSSEFGLATGGLRPGPVGNVEGDGREVRRLAGALTAAADPPVPVPVFGEAAGAHAPAVPQPLGHVQAVVPGS